MRVIWIVMDSVGIGKAPDAEDFGDRGSDTLKSCYETGKLDIPNMRKLGIFNIAGMDYGEKESSPKGNYARMRERSAGKDTTIGHWEMAGVISAQAFPTYPEGFPKEILDVFREKTKKGILCNRPYSGTEVIKKYGRQHEETGDLIVYTSADSVFQIAAHEDVVPIDKLYEYCKIARELLRGKHAVARVIARPFKVAYPDYVRTKNRHDFSLIPPKDTILDMLQAQGKEVIGVGKIYDIFAGKGIGETKANQGNDRNMDMTIKLCEKKFDGLCFVNLVDFDMVYGHRRDADGYANALNAFDRKLGKLMGTLEKDDVLIITADHGCDPGYRGTDHTRETVPMLCYGEGLKQGQDLGVKDTYADIAATIAELFHINYTGDGESFYQQIRL